RRRVPRCCWAAACPRRTPCRRSGAMPAYVSWRVDSGVHRADLAAVRFPVAELALRAEALAIRLARVVRRVLVEQRARAGAARGEEREDQEPSHHASSFATMAPPSTGAIANGGATSRRW